MDLVMIWMVQLVEECANKLEAEQLLADLVRQEGFVAGRVLPREGGKPCRVQAFFPDVDDSVVEHLPDGCRRVLVPESLLRLCEVSA
jgi:hypothetical protein